MLPTPAASPPLQLTKARPRCRAVPAWRGYPGTHRWRSRSPDKSRFSLTECTIRPEWREPLQESPDIRTHRQRNSCPSVIGGSGYVSADRQNPAPSIVVAPVASDSWTLWSTAWISRVEYQVFYAYIHVPERLTGQRALQQRSCVLTHHSPGPYRSMITSACPNIAELTRPEQPCSLRS